jgi:DNA-binding Xre family transcriptional regulator
MIKVTIRRAAKKAGLTTAYQLQKLAGFSPAVAADLWRGEKLPRLETLDRLCHVLDCDLPDLIQRNGHTRAGPQKRAPGPTGKKR